MSREQKEGWRDAGMMSDKKEKQGAHLSQGIQPVAQHLDFWVWATSL